MKTETFRYNFQVLELHHLEASCKNLIFYKMEKLWKILDVRCFLDVAARLMTFISSKKYFFPDYVYEAILKLRPKFGRF